MLNFLKKIFSCCNSDSACGGNSSSACGSNSSPACGSNDCCSESNKIITFDYFNPAAKEVFICADFNNWSTTANRLTKDKTGRFKIDLELKPGKYQYKFLVDGNWMIDQKPSTMVDNAFGTKNSLIEIC